MRILGKVTMTVQTIHEGLASGNIPFKANVVLDLYKCLEIDAVAGVKLRKRQSGKESEIVLHQVLRACAPPPLQLQHPHQAVHLPPHQRLLCHQHPLHQAQHPSHRQAFPTVLNILLQSRRLSSGLKKISP